MYTRFRQADRVEAARLTSRMPTSTSIATHSRESTETATLRLAVPVDRVGHRIEDVQGLDRPGGGLHRIDAAGGDQLQHQERQRDDPADRLTEYGVERLDHGDERGGDEHGEEPHAHRVRRSEPDDEDDPIQDRGLDETGSPRRASTT